MMEDTFSRLTDQDRRLLFRKVRRIAARRGDVVLAEGVLQKDLFLVRAGYVRVERAAQGQGIAVARLGPGQVFGEMSFLEEAGAAASVVAEEDVTVDVVEWPDLESLLADQGFAARFYHSLAVNMAHRLRKTNDSVKLLREEARRGASRPDRTGQITERQMPDGLTDAVGMFKDKLHALIPRLTTGRTAPGAGPPPVAGAAVPAVQQEVNEACDLLCAALRQFTGAAVLAEAGSDDLRAFRSPDQLANGIGALAFRETFPLFMTSATMARCYMKPRGYPEDEETLGRIDRNEPAGDGPLGPYLDRWFLSRPICRARRASRERMTALIQQVAAAVSGPGPVRITSLACGTAEELFDLPANAAGRVYATCIGGDPDALRAVSEIAKDRGSADHITFLQADVVGLAGDLGRVALGPQRLIYALGLCDYLPDDRLPQLLDWLHDHLGEGGSLALDNLHDANPDLPFMEHILEWKVHARTEEQLRELIAGSKFRDRTPRVERDEAGLFLVVTRP
jgi:CRP-like cAMP-binding protein